MNQEMLEKLYHEKPMLFLFSVGLFQEISAEVVSESSEWEQIAVIVRAMSSLFQEDKLHEISQLLKSFAQLEPGEGSIQIKLK